VSRFLAFISAVGLAALAVTSSTAAREFALPTDIEQYLLRVAKFTPAETASLEAGKVIVKLAPGGVEQEVFAIAAVKVRTPRKQVIAYYGRMVAYVDGEVTTGFGRFSNPPTLADVKGMSLDAAEVAQVKSCQPGDCDLRFSGNAITKVRTAVDWNGADPAGQVNALLRQSAVDYVSAYMKSGDDALITYGDRATPTSLKAEWRSLLQGSPYFQQYTPALRDFLSQYPRRQLPGATNIIYWVNDTYAGLKPVISIVHGVSYEPPDQPDRTVLVQKQLYASHYYDGSLAVAVAVEASESGTPVTYLIYGNRSRGDALKGGFGGLKRRMAADQARKAAVATLETIKTQVEKK
jgi:hypothetical protein